MPQDFAKHGSLSCLMLEQDNKPGGDYYDYVLRKIGMEMMSDILLSAKYGEKNPMPIETISGWREQGFDDIGKHKIYLKGPIEIVTYDNVYTCGRNVSIACTVDRVIRDKEYDKACNWSPRSR